MNVLCLSGYVGAEKKIIKADKIAKFSLAVEDNYFSKEKNEWVNGTMWVDCMLFGNAVNRTVEKGDKVEVVGSLKINNWKDKEDKWHTQVNCNTRELKIVLKKNPVDKFNTANVDNPADSTATFEESDLGF